MHLKKILILICLSSFFKPIFSEQSENDDDNDSINLELSRKKISVEKPNISEILLPEIKTAVKIFCGIYVAGFFIFLCGHEKLAKAHFENMYWTAFSETVVIEACLNFTTRRGLVEFAYACLKEAVTFRRTWLLSLAKARKDRAKLHLKNVQIEALRKNKFEADCANFFLSPFANGLGLFSGAGDALINMCLKY